MNSNLRPYSTPRILAATEVRLEQAFLGGSIVDALNAGGINTTPQIVESTDIDSGGFNFIWE
jgi:hypothetical protein